jgi:hypothetical protein
MSISIAMLMDVIIMFTILTHLHARATGQL